MVATAVLYNSMKTFDCSAVVATMLRTHPDMPQEEAERTLDAFLQWVSLIPRATKADPLQMIETVDRAWHAFILNTRLYREFCHRFFGRFIDHDALDPLVKERPRGKYARHTIELLQEEFGNALNPLLLDLLSEVTCCNQSGGCGGDDDGDDDAGLAWPEHGEQLRVHLGELRHAEPDAAADTGRLT